MGNLKVAKMIKQRDNLRKANPTDPSLKDLQAETRQAPIDHKHNK
jgi:hypothetical protein